MNDRKKLRGYNYQKSGLNEYEALLLIAVEDGLFKQVRVAVEKFNVDVNVFKSKAIKLAASAGHTNILKYLIDKGGDATVMKNYPIRTAAFYGRIKTVEYLLSLDEVDPSDHDNDAIQQAASALGQNTSQILDLLLADDRVIGKLHLIPTYNITNLMKYKIAKLYDIEQEEVEGFISNFLSNF